MDHRKTPRILLVEDNPETAIDIQEALQEHFGAGCIKHCATIARASHMDVNSFDMVLCEMNLNDGTGLDLLDQFIQRRADLPVILLTVAGVLDTALHAIKQGAYDYVLKTGDFLFTIPIVVEKNLALWRTKQENLCLQEELAKTVEEVGIKNDQLEEAITQLESMASTDPLTGLANRRAFNDSMERRFAEASRYDHDLACIMIDLDGFKSLNDSLGHQAGDELLKRTARILEANCRRSDIAGRFGGDEFVILLPETGLKTARIVATRIKQEFEAMVEIILEEKPGHVSVSMSMGVTCLRHSRPTTPSQLLGHADKALYTAKEQGKKRVVVYDAPELNESTIASIGA